MTKVDSEARGEVLAQVGHFADEVVRPAAQEIDVQDQFPDGLYAKLAGIGALAATAPERLGGSGLDTLTFAGVVEELGAASASVSNAVCVSSEIASLLAEVAPDHAAKYVPKIAAGEIIPAFALTEAHAGADVAAMRMTAGRVDGGYVLSGVKAFITNAATCDVIVVFARTSGERKTGISAFLVEAASEGVSMGSKGKFLGVRGLGTGELVFENCFVPKDRLLLEEGRGFDVALANIGLGRILMASQATGIAREALSLAVEYANIRSQFGRPISDFQGIRFMIADMATQVEAARLLVERAASLHSSGKEFELAASQAKLFAADMAMEVASNSVQILGAYGYEMESSAQRLFRDAKLVQIYEGSSQIQRVMIARQLLGTRRK